MSHSLSCRFAPSWLGRLRERALDLVFPPSCLACEKSLVDQPARYQLCMACFDRLELLGDAVCRGCAAPVPEYHLDHSRCPRCGDAKLKFDHAIAVGGYDGLLRELVLAMKQQRSERNAFGLGQMLAERITVAGPREPFDGIAAVPMHPWRRLVRGTNPAAALAGVVSRELGLPFFDHLLKRRSNVPPQHGLSRPARLQNVRSTMATSPRYRLDAANLLLVDDVLTTGASCSEAAKELKKRGAAQVSVAVVCRTLNE